MGLSADTAPSLRKFHEELGLQFPLLSDFRDRSFIGAYNILNARFGTAKRRTYIIDKDGVIRKIIVNDKDMQAHSIEAAEAVKSLS